jgi:RNA polymerase sigma-19 factor, ECF subfamily
VESYARDLRRYLARRLSRHQDVDDLAQEVYARLLRIDDDKQIEKPLAFLFGVAAHVLADHRLADRKQEHVSFDSELADDAGAVQHTSVNQELAERLSLQQQLERAIEDLPPMHRAILVACKRDGHSSEEVAARLGVSVHTVNTYLSAARAQLRMKSWDR